MKPRLRNLLPMPVLMAGILFLVVACGEQREPELAVGHADIGEEEFERGPHNGRLLRDGEFALEITILETGVAPEFRVYPFRNGLPIDPADVELTIETSRLGGRVDRFAFSPRTDYMGSDSAVHDPHSFDVSVVARTGNRESRWRYASYEGRTVIDPAIAKTMGVVVEQATRGTIRETAAIQGTLELAPDAVTEVRGRYPGIVLSLHKNVGDSVQEGEELARLQSNESMQTYVVTAPVSGTVISRIAAAGSAAGAAPLYVIANPSRLVADLNVFPRDRGRVAVGQPIVVSGIDGSSSVQGTIGRILPTVDATSQAATARVYINDGPANWLPGQFVEGVVSVGEFEVPLAVRESGLQSFRDFTVVYARVDDTYEVRMLELGRRDGEYVEVLGGLEAGTTYVVENSYLVKADIEKSGASHDH